MIEQQEIEAAEDGTSGIGRSEKERHKGVGRTRRGWFLT